jgi:aminopeptidase
MESISRYGTPHTRLISMLKSFEYPFRNVQSGDKFLILTDDQMDPLIWQAMMGALHSKGAEVCMCLYPKREYHCADPSPLAIGAAKEADVVIALTTTALNSGTPGLRSIRSEGGAKGKTPIWLWEEINQDILIEGGGSCTEADVIEMCDIQRRLGEVFDAGTSVTVKTASGTDLTADITGYPEGALARRWGAIPFERDKQTGRFGVSPGTWPFGEFHVEPLQGTANGVVVWDRTGQYPAGNWHEPVRLEIQKGKVVDISGGHEAAQIRRYLEKFGDENSMLVGGEISIGTNRKCPPHTGNMRSEKKRYGAMHFGIGHGADRGDVVSKLRLEGISDRVTMIVDDKHVVAKDGEILV